jgi:hypothetical protein
MGREGHKEQENQQSTPQVTCGRFCYMIQGLQDAKIFLETRRYSLLEDRENVLRHAGSSSYVYHGGYVFTYPASRPLGLEFASSPRSTRTIRADSTEGVEIPIKLVARAPSWHPRVSLCSMAQICQLQLNSPHRFVLVQVQYLRTVPKSQRQPAALLTIPRRKRGIRSALTANGTGSCDWL